jgi:hypothetical protein
MPVLYGFNISNLLELEDNQLDWLLLTNSSVAIRPTTRSGLSIDCRAATTVAKWRKPDMSPM